MPSGGHRHLISGKLNESCGTEMEGMRETWATSGVRSSSVAGDLPLVLSFTPAVINTNMCSRECILFPVRLSYT